MRALPRRAIRGIGATLALVFVAAITVFTATERRLDRSYAPDVDEIVVTSDASSIQRGRYLVRVVGQCTACHGDDLAGRMMADDAWLGRLFATNLTPGRGGIDDHTTADLVRSIRHGVKRDGRSVLLMPSQYLHGLSDADLAAIIAYLRRLAPIDREHVTSRAGPLARLVLFLGKAPDLLAAEAIERRGAARVATLPAATAEYGAYLVEVAGCKVCHHEDLSGGRHPLALPGEPPPPNITSVGPLRDWSEQDFFRTLRTGTTPGGRRLDDRFMPWRAIAQMGDLELRAIWLHLLSLGGNAQR